MKNFLFLFTTPFLPFKGSDTSNLVLYSGSGIREIKDDITNDNLPWWNEGLSFSCTGCGKCCINDGEVWMDTEEFVDLSHLLKLSNKETLDEYVERVQSGWVLIRNFGDGDDTTDDRCVFLSPEDSKSCNIYSVRPSQCRTYPYWPRLLTTREDWDEEAVLPPYSKEEGKRWNPDEGGCEGMNSPDNTVLVPPTQIYRNREMYDFYSDSMPWQTTGDDTLNLLNKADMMTAVHTSTRAWVSDFVIKYDLCPFAEAVFSKDNIRYRTLFASDRSAIISKLRYEILHLLTTPEDECATTLLMLPFAYSDFEDWNDFVMELEDEILPEMLYECRGGSLVVDNDKVEPEIQLATFHPGFQWADLPPAHSLNYEKKAPFPTINLLRASRVREWADEMRTNSIGNNNEKVLESVGDEILEAEFRAIVELALGDSRD